MNQDFFYRSEVNIDAYGKRSVDNGFVLSEYGHLEKFMDSEVAKALVQGECVLLADNAIYVKLDVEKHKYRARELLDLSKKILQEDFGMDCVDDFGIHRVVKADSVVVSANNFSFLPDRNFQIMFSVVADLASLNLDLIEKCVKRDCIVKVDEMKIALEALKLVHEKPTEYKVQKSDGVNWLCSVSFRKRNLWNVYAKHIKKFINTPTKVLECIQDFCPDKELRERLQKISVSNAPMLDNLQREMNKNYAKNSALCKLLDLGKIFSLGSSEIQKQVGLYIVRQIRTNPEKYVESSFSVIKDCALEILDE